MVTVSRVNSNAGQAFTQCLLNRCKTSSGYVSELLFCLYNILPFCLVFRSIRNYFTKHPLNSDLKLFLKGEGNTKVKKDIITSLGDSPVSEAEF